VRVFLFYFVTLYSFVHISCVYNCCFIDCWIMYIFMLFVMSLLLEQMIFVLIDKVYCCFLLKAFYHFF